MIVFTVEFTAKTPEGDRPCGKPGQTVRSPID
jgi:hypothetical protein